MVYLYKTGVISHRTALEWLDDVPDPEAELERIRREHEDSELDPQMAVLVRQAAGEEKTRQPPRQPLKRQEEPGRYNAAPPVPTLPSMPTQRNAPFLQRGEIPNFRQLGGLAPGRGPGVNPGPPMEGVG
ncbi:MAG TPA: hypothetical protein EYP17_09855 [Candidatus Latescibacteria bacterium]|nr:hypothetical protein [Candidatus Latescibacterota bacterium]